MTPATSSANSRDGHEGAMMMMTKRDDDDDDFWLAREGRPPGLGGIRAGSSRAGVQQLDRSEACHRDRGLARSKEERGGTFNGLGMAEGSRGHDARDNS